MKVEIFRAYDPLTIEAAINEWLEKNPNAEILKTNQTETIIPGVPSVFSPDWTILTTISIWYEMKEEDTPASVNFFINGEPVEIDAKTVTGKFIKALAEKSPYKDYEVWKVDGFRRLYSDILEDLQILDEEEITIEEGDRFRVVLKADG